MFQRKDLKDTAKEMMKRSYWMMFAVSLVAAILMGSFMNSHSGHSTEIAGTDMSIPLRTFASQMPFTHFTILAAIGFFAFMFAILGICYTIFISNPIEMGECSFYLHNTSKPAPFTSLFSAFRNGYFNVVKILLLRDLKIIGWSLLFVLPGIYKSYEYYMLPYILAEDPTIDATEAFQLTKELTQGQKLDIFVLQVSFLGWDILGLLLFGIGLFFVLPYKKATYAQLYFVLRDNQQEHAYFHSSSYES